MLTVITKVSGKTPFIFGYSIQRVSSSSMKPTLEVGDIILCRQCDPMTLQDGDIITYEGKRGEFKDKLVTHRVIKAPYLENGEYYLLTKGDDNPYEDSAIPVGDVLGIYQQKIDFLAPIFEFFITPWGLLTMIALIILAFFGDIVNLFKALLGIDSVDKNEVNELIEKYKNETPTIESDSDTAEDEDTVRLNEIDSLVTSIEQDEAVPSECDE